AGVELAGDSEGVTEVCARPVLVGAPLAAMRHAAFVMAGGRGVEGFGLPEDLGQSGGGGRGEHGGEVARRAAHAVGEPVTPRGGLGVGLPVVVGVEVFLGGVGEVHERLGGGAEFVGGCGHRVSPDGWVGSTAGPGRYTRPGPPAVTGSGACRGRGSTPG